MILNKDLYFLVHSLNDGEKISIEKQLIQKKNIRFKLFKLYNQSDPPTDLALNKIPNVSVHQNHLKNYLLTQLYSNHKSILRELQDYLIEIEILNQRGLYKWAVKILVKAKELAENYELFDYLLIINSLEKTIYNAKKNGIKDALSSEILQKEKKHYLHNLNSEYTYEKLKDEFRKSNITQFHLRENESVFETKNDIEILLETPSSSFFRNYYLHYFCKQLIAHSKGNMEAALQWSLKRLILFEDKKWQKIYPTKYLQVLSAVCDYSLRSEDLQAYEKYAAMIDNMIIKNRKTELYIFEKCTHNKLLYLHKTNASKEVIINYLKEIYTYYQDNLYSLNKESRFLFPLNLALLYFYQEAYNQSFEKLEVFFNLYEKKEEWRQDTYQAALLFSLALQFERDNKTILSSLALNIKRKLKRRKQLFETEKTILQFFQNKPLYQLNKKETQDSFLILNQKLEEISKNPLEKNLHKSFNWLSWTKKKAQFFSRVQPQ